PLSPRRLLPAASSHGPRTTSDVIAAPRAPRCAGRIEAVVAPSRSSASDGSISWRRGGREHRTDRLDPSRLVTFKTRPNVSADEAGDVHASRHSKLVAFETRDPRDSWQSSLVRASDPRTSSTAP